MLTYNESVVEVEVELELLCIQWVLIGLD